MKLVTWNLENLFILMDFYNDEDLSQMTNEEWESLSSSCTHKNKHLGKLEEMAKVIEELDADVYFFQEVGGHESIRNFKKYFLNNNYKYYIKPGNSSRGICTSFLVKKGFEYDIDLITNKNYVLDNGSRISRDFLQLNLSKNDEIKLSLLNVHLKSQRSSEEDFNGIKQRASELNGLKAIANKIGQNCPVIIGGDFNVDLNSYESNGMLDEFINFHDLKKSSVEDRCSHVFFSQTKVLNQLDYLLVNKKNKDILDLSKSYNYRFKNEYGDDLGIPDSLFERQMQPSDHFPVVIEIKEDKL